MNSINEQQVEQNHEDLSGNDAIEKMRSIVEKTHTCFFCTDITNGKFKTRPMTVQHVDEEGNCWFLSAADSHLNEAIRIDNNVQLLFQGSPHSALLNVYGMAGISKDRKMIEALWKPLYKTWFTEGEKDPRITVIMFKPEGGYYWDNKHGNTVAFLKMAFGAVTGQTMDDSIEGKLEFDQSAVDNRKS